MKIPKLPYRLGLIGLPVLGILFFQGCLASSERESPSVPENGPSADMTSEEGAGLLAAMGYAPGEIARTKTGFIVEGDMFFSSADLAGLRAAPLAKTSQRQSTPISSPAPHKVTVTIHSSMSDWAGYVSQAVNEWNSVHSRLHLTLVPSGGNIVVYSDTSLSCPAGFRNLADGVGGIAAVAAGGSPGFATCINKDSPALTNDPIRVMTVTHELGHTIGFHHTNTNSGTLIPGTPVTDNLSLMGTSGSPGRVLSAEDVKALEIMYPSDKPLGGTDLDGDHKDDIVVWRPSDGKWYALASTTSFTSGFFWQWGQRGDMPMADMDMDGDGLDDKVIWRTGDGFWHAVLSATNTVRSIQFGQAGDVPISNHDMDGDGKDDLVLWRWKEAKFFVRTSVSNFAATSSFAWGAIGDIPVGGIDADGDGKDDWAVWRPTEAKFYVKFSLTGFMTSASFAHGALGDIPVGSTDPDRDGKDDLTLWRPTGGFWTALLSGGDYLTQKMVTFGFVYAVPVVGTDLDQDGLRDMPVWDPANGTWRIRTSSSNFASTLSFAWGQ
jgi:hypothetical protein